MGGKPSIHIQTPQFIESEWQYEQTEVAYPEYGMYRTLSNKRTGELIDEYALHWINEEEYSYYLKSFNWRSSQQNVVNTKFIVQKSQRQFCAQTFTAKVYIQHVISRLSQIKDVPYPDNLFLLMESLEGYNRIYMHSKYFVIEEGQICVDADGNIKVWVNSDLSINYPNSQERAFGEEEMAERLVYMIAENTDRQTEPQKSFLEYYEERKGPRGKRFEEVKVMVLDYARENNQKIPNKFQSIMTLGNEEEEYTEPQEQPNLNYAQSSPENHLWEGRTYTSNYPPRMSTEHGEPYPIAVIPPPMNIIQIQQPGYLYPQQQRVNQIIPGQAFPSAPQPYLHQIYQSTPAYIYQQPAIQQQQQIIQIPHYNRIEHPVRQQQQPISQQAPLIQPPSIKNEPISSVADSPVSNKIRSPQILIQKAQETSNKSSKQNLKIDIQDDGEDEANQMAAPDDIRVTFNKSGVFPGSKVMVPSQDKKQRQESVEKCYDQEIPQQNQQKFEQSSNGNRRFNHTRNNSHKEQSNNMSQTDDLVARSLPIKKGYPNQTNQQLSSFGNSDRSAFSHINTFDQFHSNADGFGLNKEPSKPKEASLGQSRKKTVLGNSLAKQQKAVKYYYSLQEELEIDPDIAADLARYLG